MTCNLKKYTMHFSAVAKWLYAHARACTHTHTYTHIYIQVLSMYESTKCRVLLVGLEVEQQCYPKHLHNLSSA
jgi:hypothetical protein